MKLLKQLKWNLILMALAFIALGIILIIWPTETLKTSCYILAVFLIAIGVVSLISYMRKDISRILYRYDLVVGVSAALGGVLVIIKAEQLMELIPVVLGFLVTISGILKIQNSIDMFRLGHGTWHIAFAFAIINIAFGVVLLINPFAWEVFIACIGVALVYSGVTDLYMTIAISIRLKNMQTEIIVREESGGNGMEGRTDGKA